MAYDAPNLFRTSSRRGKLACLVAAALLAVLAGCSLRNDPGYNRFSPARDNPRLMRRADGVMQAAGRGVDNAERRAENIIN